jgi:hypothetical protein
VDAIGVAGFSLNKCLWSDSFGPYVMFTFGNSLGFYVFTRFTDAECTTILKYGGLVYGSGCVDVGNGYFYQLNTATESIAKQSRYINGVIFNTAGSSDCTLSKDT